MPTPVSLWAEKPWWCQPWSILLTGVVVVGGSWWWLRIWWISAPLALGVLLWWWLFLVHGGCLLKRKRRHEGRKQLRGRQSSKPKLRDDLHGREWLRRGD
jgi:hypothetical protein